MEVEMGKEKIAICIHSLVDVITNSSTELYAIDTEKTEGFVKELLDLFLEQFSNGSRFDQTVITKWEDVDDKDYYILPESVNTDHVYFIDIEYSDNIVEALIKKYFNVIELGYKEGY
jgi:hypothetical protein